MVVVVNKVIAYLSIINIVTFILYGIDKLLAIKKMYRVHEFSLIFLGMVGGSLGAILGMMLFHHKTRKIKFYITNISFLIIQVILVIIYVK